MSLTSLLMSTLISHVHLCYVFHIGEAAVQKLGRCSEGSEGFVRVSRTRPQPSPGGLSRSLTPLTYFDASLLSRGWYGCLIKSLPYVFRVRAYVRLMSVYLCYS